MDQLVGQMSLKRNLLNTQNQQGNPKRAKSSHACSSCRKHKTRCEQIDSDHGSLSSSSRRCHRCKVLNISCSFDEVGAVSPAPSTPQVDGNGHGHITTTSRRSRNASGGSELLGTPSTSTLPLSSRPKKATDDPILRSVVRSENHESWSGSPLVVVAEVTRPAGSASRTFTLNPPLNTILAPEQIQFLIDIFELRYSPWLNLPTRNDRGKPTPILDATRCFIAARHLDPVTRSSVMPSLKSLVDQGVYRNVFHPEPSMELVHAVAILALWAPVGDTAGEPKDSRLLAHTAVNLARILRLEQEAFYYEDLSPEKKKTNEVETEVMKEKAQLWRCLANVESLLCVGTDRIPLSYRHTLKNPLPGTIYSTADACREMRGYVCKQLGELTYQSWNLRLLSYDHLDEWHKEVLDVLVAMDSLHRIISPLPVVAEIESFQFHMLLIQYNMCRLMTLHRALSEARGVFEERVPGKPWYTQFTHMGVNLAAVWGQEALSTAETILVLTLTRPEHLNTAPDYLFAAITFAATFLIMAKLAVFVNHGVLLPGVSDSILAKVSECLKSASLGPDHAPGLCAGLIQDRLKAMENKIEAQQRLTEEESSRSLTSLNHAVSAERETLINHPSVGGHTNASTNASSPMSPLGGMDSNSIGMNSPQPLPNLFDSVQNDDYNRFMNSELFMDAGFWASFMDNMSTEATVVV